MKRGVSKTTVGAAVVGGALIEGLFPKAFVDGLDWIGRFELVRSYLPSIPAAAMIGPLPSWLLLLAVALGFSLIFWDRRTGIKMGDRKERAIFPIGGFMKSALGTVVVYVVLSTLSIVVPAHSSSSTATPPQKPASGQGSGGSVSIGGNNSGNACAGNAHCDMGSAQPNTTKSKTDKGAKPKE